MTISPEAQAKAEGLLPCKWRGHTTQTKGHHSHCPGHYRPGVASALQDLMDRNEALRVALESFASFGQTEDDGDIRDGLMRDRICDWFGPSDFDTARTALSATDMEARTK